MSTSTPNSHSAPAVACVFCASSPGTNPSHMASARALAKALHDANISLVYGGGTVGVMGELAKTLVSLSGPKAVHGVIPRALIKTEKGYDGTSVGEAGKSINSSGHNGVGGNGGGAGGKEAEKTITRQQYEESIKEHRHGTPSQLKESGEFGETTVVADMHTRKRMMAQRVIDGGVGSGFVALAGGYGTIEEVMEMVTWNQLGIHRCPIVLVNVDGYWDGLLQWVRKSVAEGFVGEKNKDILVEVKRVEDVVGALRSYRVSEARYELNWEN